MEKKVLSCLQYVPASEIWPGVTDYIDKGEAAGLKRGYNIQVKSASGETSWEPCAWISGTVEQYLETPFMKYWYGERGIEATGRICFRGYGYEQYSAEEDDMFIVRCTKEGEEI